MSATKLATGPRAEWTFQYWQAATRATDEFADKVERAAAVIVIDRISRFAPMRGVRKAAAGWMATYREGARQALQEARNAL